MACSEYIYLQFTSPGWVRHSWIKYLKGTIIYTGSVPLLGADVFPYKLHLDATIHWCNLPAHFWRTNYCALVKQTIWNASLLNRACQGSRATPSPPRAAFVLLLLVLSCICLLSEFKAHQLRVEKRLCSTQDSEVVKMCLHSYQFESAYVWGYMRWKAPSLHVSWHMISRWNCRITGESAQLM